MVRGRVTLVDGVTGEKSRQVRLELHLFCLSNLLFSPKLPSSPLSLLFASLHFSTIRLLQIIDHSVLAPQLQSERKQPFLTLSFPFLPPWTQMTIWRARFSPQHYYWHLFLELAALPPSPMRTLRNDPVSSRFGERVRVLEGTRGCWR